MSIGKRVQESLTKLKENDFEGSLSPLCQAIDATAKRTHPSTQNKKRNTEFLRSIQGLSMSYLLKGAEITGEITLDITSEKINLETAIYEWIRCPLLHEAELKSTITLTNKPILGCTNSSMFFSRRHSEGLLLGVICSSVNSKEQCPTPISYRFFGQNMYINALWGNEALIRALIRKHFFPKTH